MKVTFLGTGTSQGVPVIACNCFVCQSLDAKDQRLRCSIHIEVDGLDLVIDTGPDFRRQMLNINAQKLDAVLFTHTHKDHTAGLDDIRPFCFKQNKDIPIYGKQDSIDQIKKEFSYIFSAVKYPGVPQVEVNIIENEVFQIKNTSVLPIEVIHGKMPIFGFRIKNFTYITDASFISEKELEKVKGSEVVVLNALRLKEHHSHFNLDQAIEVAQQINAKTTYFTHLSHYMGKHAEVMKQLPDTIELAHDGLSIDLTEE